MNWYVRCALIRLCLATFYHNYGHFQTLYKRVTKELAVLSQARNYLIVSSAALYALWTYTGWQVCLLRWSRYDFGVASPVVLRCSLNTLVGLAPDILAGFPENEGRKPERLLRQAVLRASRV